jgi:hypothetical protein
MPNWKVKVKFRDLLENYDNDADELEEIERVKSLWIERFKTIPQLKGFANGLTKVKTQTQFNNWLGSVYDYCDDNKIWVEL